MSYIGNPLKIEVAQCVLDGAVFVGYVRHDPEDHWFLFPFDPLDPCDEPRVFVGVCSLSEGLRAVVEATKWLPPGWHAWRDHEDGPWDSALVPRGPVHFFRFRIDAPQRVGVAGAYLCAWVVAESASEAQGIAITDLLEEGLAAPVLLESKIVGETDVSTGFMQYYAQARVGGASYAVITYSDVDCVDDEGCV